MEKKTLGSFIAILRKSRGMTQKELAEKLNVSDKTVSHWERDESAPDISVIPVIAEIFNVTCDELLKGEKAKSPDEISPQNTQKQQKYLFEKSYSKFRTQCLIFIGVAFLGVAFASLAYWVWAWNTFLVDLIFFIVSVFGLIIMKIQCKPFFLDEDFDEKLITEYKKRTDKIFWCSISVNIILASLCIETYGLIVAPIVGILLYLILRLTKQIYFEKKGSIIEKSIVKTVSVVLVLIISFTSAFFVLPEILTEINTPEPVQFKNMEELKSFMETEKALPEYAHGERGTNIGSTIEYKNGEYVWQCYDGSEEETIVEFVWRNNEIQHIEFYFYEHDVKYAEAIFFENSVGNLYYEISEPVFFTFYPVVILSGIFICIFKTRKKLKEDKII